MPSSVNVPRRGSGRSCGSRSTHLSRWSLSATSPDGIPRPKRWSGGRATEATGRPLAELIIPSAMRQRHSQGLGRFVETGVGPILNKRIELSAVRRDGTEFPIELSVTPIRVGNEWSFSAFLRDLTERKRAEESLRASEGRYRSLFESTPAPMWVYDLETRRILAVNTAAIAQYGYSADEFHEMTIDQLRPPEDVAVLHEHLARGTPPGFHGAGTWRHRRKDGYSADEFHEMTID